MKISKFSGNNTFGTVVNNKPVINKIKTLNKRDRADTLITFDFLTLCTKIPHKKLSKVLYELIDSCFDGCDNTYVTVTRYGPKRISDPPRYPTWFDTRTFKKAVKYFLYNCFFFNLRQEYTSQSKVFL